MSRPKLNSDAEASLDYLHEQAHSRNRPSAAPMPESDFSVQGRQQGQPVQQEDLLSLRKLQKQLKMQDISIDTLTQTTERLTNFKYTHSRTNGNLNLIVNEIAHHNLQLLRVHQLKSLH